MAIAADIARNKRVVIRSWSESIGALIGGLMTRWFPKNDEWAFSVPGTCFGIAWILSGTDVVKRFEWRTLDWRTQVRANLGQPGPDPRILVMGIGDHSTNNLGPWLFPRGYHALLQNFMVYGEPKTVVWDVIFQNRVDRDGVPRDGDSDSDFSPTTSMLSDLGTSVIFAAVSGEDPPGDDLSMLGATMPLFHIEGNKGAIMGLFVHFCGQKTPLSCRVRGN